MKKKKKPYAASSRGLLYCGDCLEILKELPNGKAQCCVTRPPRWRRTTSGRGKLGREISPSEYLEKLAEIFQEVYRVVRDDGTLWLVLRESRVAGELVGVPWSAAFALRAVGWKVRREIVVRKEGRATCENLFLFSKNSRHLLDPKALREFGGKEQKTVWDIPRLPRKEDHLSAFPPDLIRPCVLAGSRPGDVVLDPFFRLGTVGKMAGERGRDWIGVEINNRHCRYVTREVVVNPQLAFEDFG